MSAGLPRAIAGSKWCLPGRIRHSSIFHRRVLIIDFVKNFSNWEGGQLTWGACPVKLLPSRQRLPSSVAACRSGPSAIATAVRLGVAVPGSSSMPRSASKDAGVVRD